MVRILRFPHRSSNKQTEGLSYNSAKFIVWNGVQMLQARFVVTFVFAIPILLWSPVTAQDEIEFNRDIRPILSDKCFFCHGPDQAGRKANLRLDVESVAHEFAFVPGSVADSEGWRRISSEDESELMPPPETHKELSAKEKSQLKTWIQAGAKYESHWSFQKVELPNVPHPKLLDWLARDFADNGWDVKRLIKKIVLSETYQQSSAVTAKQLKLDVAEVAAWSIVCNLIFNLDEFVTRG